MSRESRRKRGAEYAEFKKQREARYEGRRKAKETFSKNYKTEQKKVGEVIGAIQEYYGDENFYRSMWTSEELLDEYERVFVKNKSFSDLKAEDINDINNALKKEKIPVEIKPKQPTKIAVDLSDAKEVLGQYFGF